MGDEAMNLEDLDGETVKTIRDEGGDLHITFKSGVVLVVSNFDLSEPPYILVMREVTEMKAFKEPLNTRRSKR